MRRIVEQVSCAPGAQKCMMVGLNVASRRASHCDVQSGMRLIYAPTAKPIMPS